MDIIGETKGSVVYNGCPLTDDTQKVIEIMGREPDDARVYYDTYYMSYVWSYMGSTACFTILVPATEYSTATSGASLDWLLTEDDY